MKPSQTEGKSLSSTLRGFFWIAIGCFLTAFSLEVFLIPNDIIDGGIVGVAMIASFLTNQTLLPLFLIIFNIPFLLLAYKKMGTTLPVTMLAALLFFAGCMVGLSHYPPFIFEGEIIEVIVIGGLLLGMGIGLIIRFGGCLDGTEILAILINKKWGFTVGQVVLVVNIFIFTLAGFAYDDWHSSIFSFMTFIVAIQIMDKVIVGLEETKSVKIISKHSDKISQAILDDLGLGLTVMFGRGGYSKEQFDILLVICERLQLNTLRELVYTIDPHAFIAIENLHEVSYGSSSGQSVHG